MAKLAQPLPTQEQLARVFRYDFATGDLFWTDDVSVSARVRGKAALNSIASNGYRFGSYQGQYLARHRVIWKLVNGNEPAEIDHIDGDPANNKFSNLRSVTHEENCRNRKRYSTNTSGVAGVSWNARAQRWYAYIYIDTRMKNLGMFATKEEAIAARQAAELLLGYNVRENEDV